MGNIASSSNTTCSDPPGMVSQSCTTATRGKRSRSSSSGAARMIDAVNRIGHMHAPYACATVGFVQVSPNSRNTIPGRGLLHGRFPSSRRCDADPNGPRIARRLRRSRGEPEPRSRGRGVPGIPADPSIRSWSAECETPPQRRITRIRTSSAGPVTTRSTWPAWRRPRWCLFRASAGSATTRSRTPSPTI